MGLGQRADHGAARGLDLRETLLRLELVEGGFGMGALRQRCARAADACLIGRAGAAAARTVRPSAPVPPDVPAPGVPVAGVTVVAAGVETLTAGFAAAEAAAVLPSMPASAAAAPLPTALADVPAPSLSAVTSPVARAPALAVRAVVSTVPAALEFIWPMDEAAPSPVEWADRSRLADEEAEGRAIGSGAGAGFRGVDVDRPGNRAAARRHDLGVSLDRRVRTGGRVVRGHEGGAVTDGIAEAEPSPAEAPLTPTAAVVLPASRVAAADAAPEDSPMPKLVISALAVAVPVLSTCASVALSAAPTSLP